MPKKAEKSPEEKKPSETSKVPIDIEEKKSEEPVEGASSSKDSTSSSDSNSKDQDDSKEEKEATPKPEAKDNKAAKSEPMGDSEKSDKE